MNKFFNTKLNPFNKSEKGFTIVELLVVIAIISVIAAIAIPTFFNYTAKSAQATVKSDVKNTVTAITVALVEDSTLGTEALQAEAVITGDNIITVEGSGYDFTVTGSSTDPRLTGWAYSYADGVYSETGGNGGGEPPAPPAPITTEYVINVTDLTVMTHYTQRGTLVSFPEELEPRVRLLNNGSDDEGGVVLSNAITNNWDVLTIEADIFFNRATFDTAPFAVIGLGQNNFTKTVTTNNITNTAYGANPTVITGTTAPHSNSLWVAMYVKRNSENIQYGGSGFVKQTQSYVIPNNTWATYKTVFTRDTTNPDTITADFYINDIFIKSWIAETTLTSETSSHIFVTGRAGGGGVSIFDVKNLKYTTVVQP